MSLSTEVFRDGAIGGEEALGVPCHLNPCIRRSRWRVG